MSAEDRPVPGPFPLEQPFFIRLTRRELLARGARVGLALPAAGMLASACGGDGNEQTGDAGGTTAATEKIDPADIEGTAVMRNYEGWMGANVVQNFRKEFPNANVKQVVSSPSNAVQFVKRNPGALDFQLAGQDTSGPLLTAGLLVEPDWSRVPNIKHVPQEFRDAFPHGIPTDYGKTGIAYRSDIVTEKITSWADVWELAPKYSGQIVFTDLMDDSIGSTLRLLGYSGVSQDPDEIEQAKQKLIEIKPHLQAFKDYGISAGLVKGTTAIAMDWDYDVAAAQSKNPNIEWVIPEEGPMAYLEGWVALEGSEHLDVVWAFWNFAFEPEQYADFVNTTGTAYVMPAATPFVKKEIAQNPLLAPDPDILKEVEFETYVGPEAHRLWEQAWDEVKSA